jgi:TatD DNase family protein
LGSRPGVGERSAEKKSRGAALFFGSLETAQQAIALNFYIGITGPVTFKNAQRKQEMVAQLPLDRVLIETDAPYLAPHPHRGNAMNLPLFMKLLIKLRSYNPEARKK